MNDFGPALAAADHLVLTDIYSAGEDPIDGVTLATLAAEIRRSVHGTVDVVPRVDDVVPALVRAARPGDVVLTLGAGSIGAVADRLVDILKKTEPADRPGANGTPKGAGA
jgi:UDP-N-acetylmuramate--alanine ligase